MAAGVWRAVAEPATVTIGLVAGTTGAMVVDTGSHPDQGAEIRAAAERVAGVPVTHVVVTHAHHDHLFGLAGFGSVTSLAHESVAELLAAPDEEFVATTRDLGVDPAALVAPTDTLVALRAVDLGECRVELLHAGRGHTDADLVVVVPQVGVVFVGDLVEQASPAWYGPDSHPQEWPDTLDGVIGLLDEHSIVVVGHGDPVDRDFVIRTRSAAAAVAYEIEQLIARGVRLEQAEQEGEWALPYEHVRAGVEADWARAADRGIRGTRPTLPLA